MLLPSISTVSGPVIGFVNTAPWAEVPQPEASGDCIPVKTWLAIPYGQAVRWEHSKPPTPWTEPLQCTSFGPRFWQADSMSEKTLTNVENWRTRQVPDSEEAFNVNVFSTDDNTPKKAVLCWIYGGSLHNGYAEKALYDPTELLRRHQKEAGPGTIIVTFNYRINIFGFFANPDLIGEDGLVGNYGVRDCLCALQWIQQNISAFGGDPDNVTVFGESAGAWLSNVLFCSGQKLFRRAILISGAASTIGTTKLEDACPWYDKVLADYNITASSSKERLAALRKIPAAEMMASGQKYFSLGTWQLVLEKGENAIWKHSPVHSLMQGDYHPSIEEVVLGINKDEGTLFALSLQLQDPAKLQDFLKRYPDSWQDDLERLYAPSKASKEDALLECAGSLLFADSIFVSAFVHTARLLSSIPNRHTQKRIPVYGYRLDVFLAEALRNHPISGKLGVMHSFDLPYTFNMNSIWEHNSPDAKTAATIGRSFLAFAKHGKVDDWPSFEADSEKILVFSDHGETEIESISNHRKDHIDFWTKVIEAKASSTVEEDVLPKVQTT